MLTIRVAAAALSECDSLEALARIAKHAGFTGSGLPLDAHARSEMGLPSIVEHSAIITGPGHLRAILVEFSAGANGRDTVRRIAAGLSARAPHLLPLLLAREHNGDLLTIATWTPAVRGPARIAALVANRSRILDSDAETLCALSAAESANDVLTQLRWLEILGRDALTRRFYLALREVVLALGANASGPGHADDRHEIALLYESRLLFLSFVEAKGWLDEDRGFLVRSYEQCLDAGGDYERLVLRPLFFGTLNTRVSARAPVARKFGRVPFLNGGLFTPTALERRLRAIRFGDEQLGRVFAELLGRYRFTAREDSASWSEAAIDPEMLGKAFESLMVSADRKDSGAFYTPQSLVVYVTRSALIAALTSRELEREDVDAALSDASLNADQQRRLRSGLAGLTALDPACGSGAFLVHLLSELSRLHQRAGDVRPASSIRRDVLAAAIFGVDSNRTAVWLCELRLWLAVLIDSEEADPLRVSPLPNLDHHIRLGDTLLGGDFAGAVGGRSELALSRLRIRYARSSGNRKRVLSRGLDRAERDSARRSIERRLSLIAAQRRDILSAQRGVDLFGERRRPQAAQVAALRELRVRARELRAARRHLDEGGALPFSFAAQFPDVGAAGGFRIVVGNPPWVRLHRIPVAVRETLRRDFEVFRNAAWREGASGAAAGSGFASQVDLAALFTERAVKLLRPNGGLALLLPSKLWRSLAGGGVRHFLRRSCDILRLEDWSDSGNLFDAAVYPSLLVAQRRLEPALSAPDVRIVVHRGTETDNWTVPAGELGVTADQSSPFLFLPPAARAAFSFVMRAGIQWSVSGLDRPTLGVKCGLNEAFVVKVLRTSGSLAVIATDERVGEVDRCMLRPALRGADIDAWGSSHGSEHVLWTHDELGNAMTRLPRAAASWLGQWQSALMARSDSRKRKRWWEIFRTEAARNDKPRVAWSDFGKRPRATVLSAGDPTVPLNSCYVCRCSSEEDALTLCAILNSPLAAAWLNAIAEPARGGFRRYLAWTVAMLPLPAHWSVARELLAPVARQAIQGAAPTEMTLLDATLEAYGLKPSEVAPLLEWINS